MSPLARPEQEKKRVRLSLSPMRSSLAMWWGRGTTLSHNSVAPVSATCKIHDTRSQNGCKNVSVPELWIAAHSHRWGKEIQCQYCKSTVIVPDELLAPQPQSRLFTNVLLEYDFSDPSDKRSQKGKRQEFKDGHCHIHLDPTYGRAAVDSTGDFTNFSVEVDVQKISGADYSSVGVVGRLTGRGFYSFEFDYRGHYGIFEYDSHFHPESIDPCPPRPKYSKPEGCQSHQRDLRSWRSHVNLK